MHLSDGVLTLPVVAATSVAAGGIVLYSMKNIKQEEIPKISLMTAAFFVLSLISIPIGPTTIHPLLCGLLGIILGWRSPVAIFISLLLQAMLFQHGGLTTLGANVLLVSVPALVCYFLYSRFNQKERVNQTILAGITGFLGVLLAVLLLVGILMVSSSYFADGTFSVVRLLVIGYSPLLMIEFFLTAFIVKILTQVRPALIQT